VSLVDLPSTVMHLLGLPSKFPGAPLPLAVQPSTNGDTFEEPLLAEYYTVEAGPHLKSLLNSQWHYIVDYRTGAEKLFDLRADREELHDLSRSAASAAVLVEFRKRMKTIFPQIASPQSAAKAPGAAN
jgi:arylsulfatase A-like enzyme